MSWAYLFHNDQTDECYVGSTGNVERRLRDHSRALESGRHENKGFQAAFNRNPNFRVEVVPMQSRDEAFDLEQAVIDEFKGSPLLLNRSTDARYCCVEHTSESKEKLRQAALGRQHSPEAVEKIRKGLHERYANMSEDQRRRQMVAAHEKIKGVPKSEEHRARLSKARTGTTLSQEHKSSISAALKGQEFSPERRARLSQNNHRLTPVVAEGKEYPSLAEAARGLQVTPATIRGRVLSANSEYSQYYYVETENSE